MATPSFGAHFQCYKNPYATYKVLESFRRVYPDSTVVLISDNGYDYTPMAKYFSCIYIHTTSHIAYILNEAKGNFNQELLESNTIQFIERFKMVAELCPEDYIMWLEDDVKINKKITDTFRYDLNGYCPNKVPAHFLSRMMDDFSILNTITDYRFSGHGGSIFKKSKLLECLNDTTTLNTLNQHWTSYGIRDWTQDFFISVFITVKGGTVGPYDGHVDCYYDVDNNGQICVQHQYKRYYGVPMPDELKHLYIHSS